VRLTVRARLTLWYTAVLTLALVLCGGLFYLLHTRSRLAQIDAELARAEALLSHAVSLELEEGVAVAAAAPEVAEDIEMPGLALALFDADGRILSGRWDGLPSPGGSVETEPGSTAATVETGAGRFRVFHAWHRLADTTYGVGTAESLAPLDRELAGLRRTLLGSALVALVVAASGGLWIARSALRPLARMAAQARLITDRTPGQRLAAPNPEDELGLLAQAFNDLLARLESALSQQKNFMADASHELRTPVSVARTAIEVTLAREGRLEGEYRESLGIVSEQMRRLSRIVEDMFTLARADVAGLPLERRPLYLDEVVGDCVKEAMLLAAPKGVGLEWDGPRDLESNGDERRLRQMFVNLLENAIRYTPAGGSVRVTLVNGADTAEVAVTDTGPGIPEPERERIFERFVRLEATHRPGEGAGLGLAIARTIAEAHGGTLVLARSDDNGSVFLVRLPLAAPAP
jgi:heavy metal sensor kinase